MRTPRPLTYAAQCRTFLRGTLVTLAAAATALACGWSLITDHSVRFNTYRYGRGFYRLPPLPEAYNPEAGKEMDSTELDEFNNSGEWESETEDPPREAPGGKAWDAALKNLDGEDVAAAERSLREYLSLTAQPSMYDDDQRQPQRNAARDMLDAASALRQGATPKNVIEYMRARLALIQNSPIPETPSGTHSALADNWAYLRAAALAGSGSNDDALTAFREHAAKFPRSEKHEAALYMLAKLTMEASYSFEKQGCGIEGKQYNGEPIDASKVEPVEKCRDENWTTATASFKSLMSRYPHGQYFNDSRGWLAYLYRRGGMRAEALAEYYRLLGDRNDRAARLEAKKSLEMIGHEYDDATLDKLESLIAAEPDAAMAYAYHRVYNFAVDNTYQKVRPWYSDWEQIDKERKRVSEANRVGGHELERVARFASAMMDRYPRTAVGGGFVLRVAEVHLEQERYDDARRMAEKAIALGVGGELRAEALWVKGSAEHGLKRFRSARRTLERLVGEFPKHKLADGARRLIALAAEDDGDFETALERYLDLDYKYDVAYYVDVLMPVDRLAGFIAARPTLPKRDILLYSLGVRYMRLGRWGDARAAYAQVRTVYFPDTERWSGDPDAASSFSKDPDWKWDQKSGVKSAWVQQDLKTMDVLERLERQVRIADGDEAKAEAMYQLASYQYDADDLLIYNPAAWEGLRYNLLTQLDASDSMRLPNEAGLIFDYSNQHDTLARAIPLYVEIADRYPNTKAARDALYTAAVGHARLSELNSYWREKYQTGMFAGPRLVTYTDVKQTYPHYQLPRGSNGWEAATRTVNGGPGWAPPPKPLPKLTLWQRVERKFAPVAEWTKARYESSTAAWWSASSTLLNAFLYAVLATLGFWSVVWTTVALRHRKGWRRVPRAGVIPTEDASEGELPPLPPTDSRVEKIIERMLS